MSASVEETPAARMSRAASGRSGGMCRRRSHAAKSSGRGFRPAGPAPKGAHAAPSRKRSMDTRLRSSSYTKSNTAWLRFMSV